MYAIYAYIDPPNHPNVGKYMPYMECLGLVLYQPVSRAKIAPMMPLLIAGIAHRWDRASLAPEWALVAQLR